MTSPVIPHRERSRELCKALFGKQLSETEVEERFAFPTHHIRLFWDLNLPSTPHSQDFQVADVAGLIWTLHLSIRKQGHPKPEITRGWRHFVRSKGLKLGDMVIFYKHPLQAQGPLLFTVAIRRAIWERGSFVGYSPEE